jgi:hypothetical protein
MKTSELQGVALDWAVAKCEGYFDIDMAVMRNGTTVVHYFNKWQPSTDWAQGGPIIEREEIQTRKCGVSTWLAEIDLDEGDTMRCQTTGPTPLITAMRCFVTFCLGDEVDIPEELQ